MVWEDIHSAMNFGLESQTEWLQRNFPCLYEHISIVIQLCFLGISVLYYLHKMMGQNCKQRTKFPDKGTENHSTGICTRCSSIYKISIACSFLLMVTHLILLLLLVNGGVTYCNHKVCAFSSEGMQVVSWAISSIAVYQIVNIKSIKFHWLLRAWWCSSFFLSIISVAADTHFHITYHDQLRLQDYADLFSVLASTCLFTISLQGKTGLVITIPNGITEPLLNGKGDKQSERRRESPYGKATLLQLFTFSWLNPLFAVGVKRPLDQEQIPDVDIKDSAEYLSHSFDEKLQTVKERDGTTNPEIYKTIYLFIRKKAAINAMFAVISAVASYVGPYLIDDFVNYLTEKKSRSVRSGYMLALAFLGAKMVETVAQRQWIFGARQLGLRLRAALISQIFKKGLRLSSLSRQSHTSGEVINYMSVDIQRIIDFIWYLNIIWMMPIQISLAMYILHTNLGMGLLAALAATLGILFCNIPMTNLQKRYQTRIMEAKDNRMKATSEILQSMKIKLQAWDSQFLHKSEQSVPSQVRKFEESGV